MTTPGSSIHAAGARILDVPPGGPGVIGATGGSGTRVVARVARAGGMFIGKRLNRSDDAVDFGAYSDAWINRFVTRADDAVLGPMTDSLEQLLAEHLAGRRREPAWGWKEPRSIYLLPFLHGAMPSLRFLHVVRDGRDMAFSSNQQQPAKHGEAALGTGEEASEAERSIALWAHVNTQAADYGERVLGAAYARIRYEDLCLDPEPAIEQVLAFFALEGDPRKLARKEVKPPSSLGRWRHEDPGVVAGLERIAGDALARLGYA
jgi:sulfotransferase family protein